MIVHMASTEEEARSKGEFLAKVDCNGDGLHFVYTYGTHKGLCVAERENNGSWDSDFYMTYFDPEKNTFCETMFATTRGWSYPCLASTVDAPPELMQKYKEHLNYQHRKNEIFWIRRNRRSMFKVCRETGFKFSKVKRIYSLYGNDKSERMFKLVTGKLRSKFKISLRDQFIKWMKGESQYQFPFTMKQLDYI